MCVGVMETIMRGPRLYGCWFNNSSIITIPSGCMQSMVGYYRATDPYGAPIHIIRQHTSMCETSGLLH